MVIIKCYRDFQIDKNTSKEFALNFELKIEKQE